MSVHSPKTNSVSWVSALVGIALLAPGGTLLAQSGPSPYRTVDGWAQLPDGRQMGAVGKVTMDTDGEHIWAVIRCDASAPGRFGNECVDSDLDPVVKFDLDGNVVESMGSGLFIWPHGIDVDQFGNVWVTDAVSSGRIPEGDTRITWRSEFGRNSIENTIAQSQSHWYQLSTCDVPSIPTEVGQCIAGRTATTADTIRITRCKQVHISGRRLLVHLPQRRQIVQDPKGASSGRGDEIVVADLEIVHGGDRQVELKRLPVIAVVK